jgi:hypothetical protein
LIIDDPENPWIWIRPSSSKPPKQGQQALREYFEHFGKWLIFSRDSGFLEELARRVDPYVEREEIASAKYKRAPDPLFGPDLVMCVYCDDRERERVWNILSSLGVTRRIWKYDRQTLEDWSAGGRLDQKAKRAGER